MTDTETRNGWAENVRGPETEPNTAISGKTAVKKTAGALLWLCGFVILYLFIFNLLYVEDLCSATQVRGFYQQGKDTVDVVCIGSSTVYANFNAPYAFHEYGIAAYDFSTAAQPFSAARHLIAEAERTQSPRLYVIDLKKAADPVGDPNKIRLLTAYMPWSENRINAAKSMIAAMPEKDGAGIWNYLLTYPFFHNNWRAVFSPSEDPEEEEDSRLDDAYADKEEEEGLFTYKRAHESSTDVYHGFCNEWWDSGCWQYIRPADEYSPYVDDLLEIPEKQEEVLRDLCEYCLTLDAKVLFVNAPSVLSAEHYARMNTVVSIVRSYGFDYFNGSDKAAEFGITANDWYDAGHLNSYGSEKYTKALSEYILGHYDIPDRREDPGYDAWREDYNHFLKKRAEYPNLLFRLLDGIREQGMDAELLFANIPAFSDEEKRALQEIGMESVPSSRIWSLHIRGGRVRSSETDTGIRMKEHFTEAWYQLGADENDRVCLCIVYDPETGEWVRRAVLDFNPERELLDSDYKPSPAEAERAVGEALQAEWQEGSRLNPAAREASYDISGFLLNGLQDDRVLVSCVFALANTSCTGQKLYAEFENAEGLFRVFPMETVRRADFAGQYHNDGYTDAGAAVVVSREELPDGDYTVRLYREKYGHLFTSKTVWTAHIDHTDTEKTVSEIREPEDGDDQAADDPEGGRS